MITFTDKELKAIKGSQHAGDSIWKVPGFTKCSIKSAVKKIETLLKEKGFDVKIVTASTFSTYIEASDANDNIVEIRVSDHFKRDDYTLSRQRNAIGGISMIKTFADGIESDDNGYFHATITSQDAAEEVLNGLKTW